MFNKMRQKIMLWVDKCHFTKKKLIIIAVVVLVVWVGIGAWIYYGTLSNKKTVKPSYDKPSVSGQTVRNSILGNYESGQAIIDESMDQASTPKEQAWLYIQKSSLALNLKKYDEAYDFASKAEKLYPDSNSSQLMADALAEKGNKTESIKQYKITISRMTGKSNSDESDRAYIQEKIDKLNENE